MLKKSIFLLAACAMLVTGCKDDSKGPILTFETLKFGAFPRLQELRTAEYDLNDLSNSTYEMVVDFVDNAGGQDVAEFNVYVEFDDNTPDNGTIEFDNALFKSYGPSDFSEQSTGNLGMTISIPFAEVANFVGAGNAGDILSGDRFRFRTEIVKEDGRTFNSVNSTPAVTGAFGGIWNFNVNATCPLDDDTFVGTYDVDYGYVYDAFDLFGVSVQPFGTTEEMDGKTVTLSLVPGSSTRRTFNYGIYLVPGYEFSTDDITLEFACDVVTSTNIDSGAGCGDGSIQASQMGVATFDIMDDNTFTIEYSDLLPSGGCGDYPGKDFSVVFTKQ